MICEIELDFVLTFFILVGSSLKSEKLLSEGKAICTTVHKDVE